MKTGEMYVIVFESTHYAIAGEDLLKSKGYKFNVIPTPREITRSCGLSIKFNSEDMKNIEEDMNLANILIRGIYKIQKTSNDKVVKQIV